jgi:hypothetical protein
MGKGKVTGGKTKGSMKPVAMHPALCQYLTQWRSESDYNKEYDWIFASIRGREEFHERPLLAENTTFVRQRSQQALSRVMIIHGSDGIICGRVWQHFSDQTKFILR